MEGLAMHYTSNHDIAPYEINMQVNEDSNLMMHFAAFVNMTKMMGFYAKSWEDIITEVYECCILHADTSPDYSLYDWAVDCKREGLW